MTNHQASSLIPPNFTVIFWATQKENNEKETINIVMNENGMAVWWSEECITSCRREKEARINAKLTED